jgi:hypothetical protein
MRLVVAGPSRIFFRRWALDLAIRVLFAYTATRARFAPFSKTSARKKECSPIFPKEPPAIHSALALTMPKLFPEELA